MLHISKIHAINAWSLFDGTEPIAIKLGNRCLKMLFQSRAEIVRAIEATQGHVDINGMVTSTHPKANAKRTDSENRR